MKVVGIVWIDTVSSGDTWIDETQEPAKIVSVGLLWKDEPDYITLVLSLSEDQLIRGFVTVPKSCIIEQRVLLEEHDTDSQDSTD